MSSPHRTYIRKLSPLGLRRDSLLGSGLGIISFFLGHLSKILHCQWVTSRHPHSDSGMSVSLTRESHSPTTAPSHQPPQSRSRSASAEPDAYTSPFLATQCKPDIISLEFFHCRLVFKRTHNCTSNVRVEPLTAEKEGIVEAVSYVSIHAACI